MAKTVTEAGKLSTIGREKRSSKKKGGGSDASRSGRFGNSIGVFDL